MQLMEVREDHNYKRRKLALIAIDDDDERKPPVLPYDILFQILLRLHPIKSVIQLCCVSKEFNTIITDSAFSRMRPPTPKSLVVQTGHCWHGSIKLFLITKQQGTILHERIDIANPMDGMEAEVPQLICACDGLLCFLSPHCYQDNLSSCGPINTHTGNYRRLHRPLLVASRLKSGFHVFNSLTKKWIVTPSLEYQPACGVCGLYKHAATGEYRILLHAENGFHIHALGTDYWRKVLHRPKWYRRLEFDNRDRVHDIPPILMHDKLHFSCNLLRRDHEAVQEGQGHRRHKPGILVFSTDVEKFRFIKKPRDPYMPSYRQTLYPFQTEYGLGYPTVQVDGLGYPTGINIWILKDYETKSWVKQYTIYPNIVFRARDFQRRKFLLAFSEEGKVLFWEGKRDFFMDLQQSGNIFLYDQKSSRWKKTAYNRDWCPEAFCCNATCHWGSLSSMNAF